MFKVGNLVKVIRGPVVGLEGRIMEITTKYSNRFSVGAICTVREDSGCEVQVYSNEIELIQPAAQAQNQPWGKTTCATLTFDSAGNITRREGYSSIDIDGWSGTVKLDLGPTKKCECGSHSVGVDNHSDYCPLYIKS